MRSRPRTPTVPRPRPPRSSTTYWRAWGSSDPPRTDTLVPARAPVAQGIEHRPPEAGAQVRILPGAPCDVVGHRHGPDPRSVGPGQCFSGRGPPGVWAGGGGGGDGAAGGARGPPRPAGWGARGDEGGEGPVDDAEGRQRGRAAVEGELLQPGPGDGDAGRLRVRGPGEG